MAEANDQIVTAIAGDPALLALWGYLRLAVRPMTLSELCATARIDVAAVQRRIDVLANFGLVKVLPATTRRPLTSYEARYQGLQIRCRRDGDHDALRAVASAMQQYAKELLPANWLAPGPTDSTGWHADFTGVFHLTPPEVQELRRRLNSLVEFTELLSNKQAKRGSSPELCNYVINFRVEPLAVPALPLAPVRFVLEGADRDSPTPASERPANGRLSARERQVATALARGLTIEEVAKEMGLARSTVSTMTKRLYRKLGVRRRAEMVTRLAESGLGD